MSNLQNQTTALVKRYAALVRAQKDLDFAVAQFSHDVRKLAGTDVAFVAWCCTNLGTTEHQARALLAKGALIEIVPDAPTWNRLGGSQRLQVLESLPSKRERIQVVEEAKASGLQPQSVIRNRERARIAQNPEAAPPRWWPRSAGGSRDDTYV